jgi:hypothetical protein
MPVLDVQVRTISCEQCDKTVTFSMKDHQQVVKDNTWLNTSRVIQTGDGRNFLYCSDECEIAGIGTSKHNVPEPKKIVDVPQVGAAQAIKIAAQAAESAKEGTKALKTGKPANLKVVR